MLIKAYAAEGTNPWNNNGFGNKDPGRNRDGTKVKAAHFDAQYPINLSLTLSLAEQDTEVRLDEFVDRLKTALPYNLRRDKGSGPQAELRNSTTLLPDGEHSVRDFIGIIARELGSEWQFTALPGYLILYKERKVYPSAHFTWRSNGRGGVDEEEGLRELASGAVAADDEDAPDD